MGTAATKDVSNIKRRVNQMISTQHKQQETLVHIIFVLNITKYATQVDRQHINVVMGRVDRTHQDVTTLYNITSSLYNSLSYQQDHTSHLLHSGKPHRFTILYETSCHAYHGLHRCSYNGYTITTCTPNRRSLVNVNTHQIGTTFNHALTSFIRGYTSFLQIPAQPCSDCRWTIPTTHQCIHTGSCTATRNIWSLQFSHTLQKFLSMLQHKQ